MTEHSTFVRTIERLLSEVQARMSSRKITIMVRSRITRTAALAFLTFSGLSVFPLVQAQTPVSPLPTHLTAEQDRQRTMDLLGMNSIRPGKASEPTKPNATNYDESKAGPDSPLPDPLLLNDGKRVTTATAWWHQRRPEIVEAFDREIYGRVPDHTPRIHWQITDTKHEQNGDIPVITRTLIGRVDNSTFPAIQVDIKLTLCLPAEAKHPVPIIMELAYGASATRRSPEVSQMLANAMAEPMDGVSPTEPGWQHQVLAKGWGYALYYPYSVQPDSGAGLTEGIIGLMNKGQPRTQMDSWGALRAWAWGASRIEDYLETDKLVDARHVAIAGHSRFGKGALVTMAYDQRFAIAFISSSGEGGANLYRRNFGEPLENVASPSEYHWMAGNFLKYAGPLTAKDLPVDSHELIALCAPRPIFIGAGIYHADVKSFIDSDGWADGKGTFLAAVAAGPVYKLLGTEGLESNVFPTVGTPMLNGSIGFRQHSGGHTTGQNWPTFLEFTAMHFPTPAK